MERTSWVIVGTILAGAFIVAFAIVLPRQIRETRLASTPRPFDGPTSRAEAQDHAAQSSLRNALIAAKTIYTAGTDYTDATPKAMTTVEPSLTFQSADKASSGPTIVSVDVVSRKEWAAAARSDSGTCYWIKDNVSEGTTYGASASTGSECTGTSAEGASSAGTFP